MQRLDKYRMVMIDISIQIWGKLEAYRGQRSIAILKSSQVHVASSLIWAQFYCLALPLVFLALSLEFLVPYSESSFLFYKIKVPCIWSLVVVVVFFFSLFPTCNYLEINGIFTFITFSIPFSSKWYNSFKKIVHYFVNQFMIYTTKATLINLYKRNPFFLHWIETMH